MSHFVRYSICFGALLSFTATVNAQSRSFPYQARVVMEEAYARSGGGDSFYPTSRLSRDEIVTVRRHDPGGWFMIDPPQQSFSWVPVRYVDPGPNGQGRINNSNVVVFVGSAFGDDTHVWQRKLMDGDTVTILGQQDVDTSAGPKPMFKIAPPKREYRWIPGNAVVPTSETARQQRDSNPYQVPSEIVERTAQRTPLNTANNNTTANGWQAPPTTTNKPQQLGDGTRYAPKQGIVRLKQIREEQKALQAIDQDFRTMILSPPQMWKLNEIEQRYLKLQNEATYKPLSGQIDLRYPAIHRYRQRKAQLEDFNRLTSATEQRDAQLLATQFGINPAAPNPMVAMAPGGQLGPGLPQVGPMPPMAQAGQPGLMIPGMPTGSQPMNVQPTMIPGQQIMQQQPFMQGQPLGPAPQATINYGGTTPPWDGNTNIGQSTITGSTDDLAFAPVPAETAPVVTSLFGSTSTPTPGPGSVSSTPSLETVVPSSTGRVAENSRFIGAGILQRSVSGDNGYVLTSRQGKVLAHVTPEPNASVGLSQHIGQPIGVQGKRWFDPNLKSDRIEVTSIEAVKLR